MLDPDKLKIHMTIIFEIFIYIYIHIYINIYVYVYIYTHKYNKTIKTNKTGVKFVKINM